MEKINDNYFPCVPSPDCPYAPDNCREDVHHNFYPGNDYKTPLERRFYKLNKIVTCRRFHETIHRLVQPPDKPSEEMMREYINGKS